MQAVKRADLSDLPALMVPPKNRDAFTISELESNK